MRYYYSMPWCAIYRRAIVHHRMPAKVAYLAYKISQTVQGAAAYKADLPKSKHSVHELDRHRPGLSCPAVCLSSETPYQRKSRFSEMYPQYSALDGENPERIAHYSREQQAENQKRQPTRTIRLALDPGTVNGCPPIVMEYLRERTVYLSSSDDF